MSTTLTSRCRTLWENAAQVHHTPSTKARSTGMQSKGTHSSNGYAQQGHAQEAHTMRARCCGPPSHRSGVQPVSATPRKMPPRPGAPRRVRTHPIAKRTSPRDVHCLWPFPRDVDDVDERMPHDRVNAAQVHHTPSTKAHSSSTHRVVARSRHGLEHAHVNDKLHVYTVHTVRTRRRAQRGNTERRPEVRAQ
jgi:hypothetical protein